MQLLIGSLKYLAVTLTAIFIIINISKCIWIADRIAEKHVEIKPDYDDVKIHSTRDTMIFPLEQNILPTSIAFNYCEINGMQYISFTDNMTQTINVYDFQNRRLVSQIEMGKIPNVGGGTKKSAHVKNFDSIYVSNIYQLYQIGVDGNVKNVFDLRDENLTVTSQIAVSNVIPPIFVDDRLYLAAYPNLFDSKLTDMKKWRVLCRINLKTGSHSFVYPLPKIYEKNLYGAPFLMPYYCYNKKKQFVFSFGADSDIYVTDLDSYNISYKGGSRFLSKVIEPVINPRELMSGEGTTKAFLKRDSYGPIYYDSYRKRYLRVAERRIGTQALISKDWKKEHSLIILDENFKIIGESLIDKELNLYTLFISPQGVFARTDAQLDENNLYFVRLDYSQ